MERERQQNHSLANGYRRRTAALAACRARSLRRAGAAATRLASHSAATFACAAAAATAAIAAGGVFERPQAAYMRALSSSKWLHLVASCVAAAAAAAALDLSTAAAAARTAAACSTACGRHNSEVIGAIVSENTQFNHSPR